MHYAVLIARLVVGGIFIYASLHKIADPADFAVSIRNYMILPVGWSNIAAMILPWIEIFSGLLLVLGILTRASALLTTTMMGIFFGAVTYAFVIGLNIDCGCFATSASSAGQVGIHHIVRDFVLLLVSLFILVQGGGKFSVAGIISGGSPAASH